MAGRRRIAARKVPLVRLRDHPKIHWPPGLAPNPPWAGPSPETPNPFGVVLTKVELVDGEEPRHLTLIGTYDGNPYRTTLTVEDRSLLRNFSRLLARCVGETVTEIGAHEVDHSLKSPSRASEV